MAVNLPTLAFWNKNCWFFSKQAEPYFNALRDVGILFNSGDETAEKVNEIWDDIEYWWKQPAIQEATKNWAWEYARTSTNWRKEWIKAIWEL